MRSLSTPTDVDIFLWSIGKQCRPDQTPLIQGIAVFYRNNLNTNEKYHPPKLELACPVDKNLKVHSAEMG